MPSKNYALDRGGPERVGVAWEGAFKELSVTFDGTPLGSFATAKELETPRSLPLPDGSQLTVALAKFGPFPELRISRDGQALPRTSGDPQTQLEGAYTMLFLVAGLNAALGLFAAMLDIGFLQSIGVGWGSVFAGIIYAGLAALVKRRSTVALAVAVGLFALDGLYSFVVAAEAKVSPPVGGLIARVFFLMPMLRGFPALNELKKPPKRVPPRSRPAAAVGSPRPVSPPANGAMAPAGTPAPASRPTAVKTLVGDAEKLRLQLSERIAAPSAVSATGRRVETKGPAGVDAARKSLRFIANRFEVGAEGFHAVFPSGAARDIRYDQVAALVARQLPPDPPWEGAFIVDVVPTKEASPEPVRIFGNTVVNYAAIPGGSSSSRLDNTRRLTAFLRDRCPKATLDEATQEFVRGPKVPQRFANMTQFIEYDTTYG